MVSLGTNSSRQGGYFFDQEASLTPSMDDQENLIVQQLGAEQENRFKSMPTVCISAVHAVLFTLMTASSYILPYVVEPYVKNSSSSLPELFGDQGNQESHDGGHMMSFYLVIYIHSGMWFVVMAIDRYIQYHHHNCRNHGYLDFCRQTNNIRRIPFAVITVGTAVLLIIVTVIFNLGLHTQSTKFWPINYIEILITLECFVALPAIIIYMRRVMKFNNKRALPDVEQDDMMSGFLQSHIQSTDIGFKDADHLDDVLEKQADMIRYLQQHNAHLGRRILKLTSSLPSRV